MKRLEVLQIVDYHVRQEGRVFFGAWIELETEDGELKQYRIVGCDEFDPAKNWISVDSPVARALIGKVVDDEVKVDTPSGRMTFYVNRIWYEK